MVSIISSLFQENNCQEPTAPGGSSQGVCRHRGSPWFTRLSLLLGEEVPLFLIQLCCKHESKLVTFRCQVTKNLVILGPYVFPDTSRRKGCMNEWIFGGKSEQSKWEPCLSVKDLEGMFLVLFISVHRPCLSLSFLFYKITTEDLLCGFLQEWCNMHKLFGISLSPLDSQQWPEAKWFSFSHFHTQIISLAQLIYLLAVHSVKSHCMN